MIEWDETEGIDGSHGGGGVVLVSRGGGFGAGGKITTNGETAPQPVYVDAVQIANSGGMPGAFIWLTDGGLHPAPFNDQNIELHFDAYSGASGELSTSLRVRDNNKNAGTGARQFWAPSDDKTNRAIAASRHQYVPENQKLRDSQNTHWLDDEASLNPDGFVQIWNYAKNGAGFANLVNGLPPVPNPGSRDLWVSKTDLDSGLPQAQLQMQRYENGVWSVITGYDRTASVMLDFCRTSSSARMVFSDSRPSNCPVGTLWIDNENTDKAVKCGETQAQDELVWLRSYGQPGDDVLEDGPFLIHAECEPTWQTDTNRNGGPNVYPGAFPKYPEQVVGSTLFSKTIGEDATPGWQLDATGTGSYRVLRPRRPIKIHPGEKYVVESVIFTGGLAVSNPDAEGYTIFATVWDQNGNKLWDNGTDTAIGSEHFHSTSTANLAQNGWMIVHEVFTVPETLTDARYLVPNAMVHAVSGNVIVSQMHVRRLRQQHKRDVTPGPFVLNEGQQYGQPGNLPSNSKFDMEIPQGSRFNFSIVAQGIPSHDTTYGISLIFLRGGVFRKRYGWSGRILAGIRQSMDVDFDYITEEFYDGFRWEMSFTKSTDPNQSVTVNFIDDFVWAMKAFDVVESGAVE